MPNDVAVELYYDGGWHDLVADDDVLVERPIVIQRGDGDESAAPRPASVELRLNNDDDMYRSSNPESPLYGKAGVNTPLRVSVGGTVRGATEASSLEAGQSRDFRAKPKRGKAWVDVEAGGLLQRINQWTEKLKSPFRQYNDTLTTSVGYWPGEQARGSTALASPTPGTSQIIFQGMAPESQYRPPGSAPLIDMGEDPAEMGGYFVPNGSGTSTSGWQLSWVARYEPLVAGEQDIMDWETTDGTAYGLYLNPTTGQMLIYSSLAGSPVLAFGSSYSGYDWSQFTMFSIDAQYSGGTTTIWVNWCNADNTENSFITTSFSGVPASLVWWDTSAFAGVPVGSTIGHVIGTNASSAGGEDLFSGARRAAWTGYLGETAADRFARLMALKGLAYSIIGTAAGSVPMGPQPVDTFAEILREIRDSEDGLIFDAIDAVELVFLLCSARYNQTPALALTPADLPALPSEVTDDLPIHNIVTASQRDGSEYTAEDSTSPMGSAPPPDGKGEYKQTKDVNLLDEAELPQVANWWLRRGTVNLPRFPQVVINLAALDATKVAEVEAVDIGSVITITGYREYTIRLFVIGYTETIGWPNARTIVFTCAPDQQFQVGVYDGGTEYTPRYDLGTCTMSAAIGIGVTTLTFAIVDDEAWSSTSAYDLLISGELVGIPIGAMGARSGSSGAYSQSATGVARAKNGVRKILPANAEVHISTPGRYAR